MNGVLKFTCRGNKFSNLDIEIKNYCFLQGLDCKVETNKGILFANYRVEIKGDVNKLAQAENDIDVAIQNYNNKGVNNYATNNNKSRKT